MSSDNTKEDMKREINKRLEKEKKEKEKDQKDEFSYIEYAREIGITESNVLNKLDKTINTDPTSLIMIKCAKQSKTPNPTAILIREVLAEANRRGRIQCVTPPEQEPIPPLTQDEVKKQVNNKQVKYKLTIQQHGELMQVFYDQLLEEVRYYKENTLKENIMSGKTWQDDHNIVEMNWEL